MADFAASMVCGGPLPAGCAALRSASVVAGNALLAGGWCPGFRPVEGLGRRFMVLGFLLRQDEDVPDVCPSDLFGVSGSGRLRLRTPMGVLCLETAGSGGIWSCPLVLY